MSQPDQPRILDQTGHEERVALDSQIAELTAQLQQMTSSSERTAHHQGLKQLRELQQQRKAAFRREVGWAAA
ncbi:hypothetical protein [Nocardia testacea]|uniref:hypothetical protein n=1 Tax=Nocardia testacea TaxID=248551 RepID=UPI0002DD1F29|nr:hypothetical protein [Nocardia testacea]